MLRKFSMSNFKSFDYDEKYCDHQLDMQRSNLRSKPSHVNSNGLLKAAVIYGGNAAGKSNLIDGLRFVKSIITEGCPPKSSNCFYCGSDVSNSKKPISFSFQILVKIDDFFNDDNELASSVSSGDHIVDANRIQVNYELSVLLNDDKKSFKVVNESLDVLNARGLLDYSCKRSDVRFREEVEKNISSLMYEIRESKKRLDELNSKLEGFRLRYRMDSIHDISVELDGVSKNIEYLMIEREKIIHKREMQKKQSPYRTSEYEIMTKELNRIDRELDSKSMVIEKLRAEKNRLSHFDARNMDISDTFDGFRHSDEYYAVNDKESFLKDNWRQSSRFRSRSEVVIQKEIENLKSNLKYKEEKLKTLKKEIADNNYLGLDQSFLTYNPKEEVIRKICKPVDSDIKQILAAIKAVYHWFNYNLEIIDPYGFVIPELDADSFINISEKIMEFDVGIRRVGWKGISDNHLIADIESSLSLDDKRVVFTCRQSSIINKIECSTVVGNKSGIYKFAFWCGEGSVKELVTYHDSDVPHHLFEESDGTKRIIELASILVDQSSDKVYVVDELDRRLHPLLTKLFVNLFLSDHPDNKQLIITTHETRILTTDLFRKDEIWFVNRDKQGCSTIDRLSDLEVPLNKRLDRVYLEDKLLGGKPQIDDESDF